MRKNIHYRRQIRGVIRIKLVKHSIEKLEIVNRTERSYNIDKIALEIQEIKIKILIRINVFTIFI
jgi:hypothetical protein